MRSALSPLLLLLATTALASGRFVSSQCGCSFEVPKGWTVTSNPEGGIEALGRPRTIADCAFGLRPKIWPPDPADGTAYGRYAIAIRLSRQTFEDAAQHAGFSQVSTLRKYFSPDAYPDKQPTDSMIDGRMHDGPAVKVTMSNWSGLEGTTTIRYYGEGPHGLGDAHRAVIASKDSRAASILSENPFTSRAFESVLRSFRFLPVAQPH
ncbi:MAG TPA: hypothetical protein VGR95_05705 [Thermoanaerobaculia bacterium]|jgi:hypothetical protein|nr:hypothetical protein [Thermoanaerobaculia bacterium]